MEYSTCNNETVSAIAHVGCSPVRLRHYPRPQAAKADHHPAKTRHKKPRPNTTREKHATSSQERPPPGKNTPQVAKATNPPAKTRRLDGGAWRAMWAHQGYIQKPCWHCDTRSRIKTSIVIFTLLLHWGSCVLRQCTTGVGQGSSLPTLIFVVCLNGSYFTLKNVSKIA